MLADPSSQPWPEKIPSLLGTACPIDQPEERKSVIFEPAFDQIDVTEGERFSTDYHGG
jgi:hypothetical protein